MLVLQSKAVATTAAEAATAVLTNMNANAVRLVLPMLFEAMNQKQKWQTKVGALQQLGALTKIAPAQMKAALPDIVPAVAGCFADAKPQVKVCTLCHLLLVALLMPSLKSRYVSCVTTTIAVVFAPAALWQFSASVYSVLASS